MSEVSRRKLLKSIAAGSGAIVAGKSLPESWSHPVVDSVLLPAHAQTSPSLEICDDTEIIPGRSVACPDAPFEEETLYTFGFADGCLSIVSESVPFYTGPSNSNELVVRAFRRPDDVSQVVDIFVEIHSTADGTYSSTQTCDATPAGSFDLQITRSLLIDGVPFTASLNIIRADTSVSLGQITVAPT